MIILCAHIPSVSKPSDPRSVCIFRSNFSACVIHITRRKPKTVVLRCNGVILSMATYLSRGTRLSIAVLVLALIVRKTASSASKPLTLFFFSKFARSLDTQGVRETNLQLQQFDGCLARLGCEFMVSDLFSCCCRSRAHFKPFRTFSLS